MMGQRLRSGLLTLKSQWLPAVPRGISQRQEQACVALNRFQSNAKVNETGTPSPTPAPRQTGEKSLPACVFCSPVNHSLEIISV